MDSTQQAPPALEKRWGTGLGGGFGLPVQISRHEGRKSDGAAGVSNACFHPEMGRRERNCMRRLKTFIAQRRVLSKE
jgi:hypothetical protein